MTATVNINTSKRDWFRILRDLAKAGISYGEVARKCERNSTTVKGWAEGSDPKDTDARIVLALYAKYCPMEYLEHQKQFAIPVSATPSTIEANEVQEASVQEPPTEA